MFSIDERLRGLPALKEQVVQLYQSLNQPHLAVPGRRAGPAQAFVLGLRGPSGFAVFVYLHLGDSAECAVYVPSSGTVPSAQYQNEEAEALGFTESMGAGLGSSETLGVAGLLLESSMTSPPIASTKRRSWVTLMMLVPA